MKEELDIVLEAAEEYAAHLRNDYSYDPDSLAEADVIESACDAVYNALDRTE